MIKVEATDTLSPDALKFYRSKVGLSQQGLADKSKISKSQISRWERGQQTTNIHQHSRERLCRALEVRWGQLTRAPEPEVSGVLMNRVPLKADVAGSARTALTFVQLIYGLRQEAIIDLAPLAFLILAERSLQSRQAALAETVQALEAATGEACRRLPYMPGAFRDGYDYEWVNRERTSIEGLEVYEEYIDDAGEQRSPFVDFLEKELKALGLFQNHPIEFGSSYRGAPSYAIPAETLAQFLDLNAADEAHRHTLERIQEGRIDFREAFEKKESVTQEEYRHWLTDKSNALEQELEAQRKRWSSKWILKYVKNDACNGVPAGMAGSTNTPQNVADPED
jgi:transcriptional regulator with XRE-family HTH domain